MHIKGISRKHQLSLAISLVLAAGMGQAMAAPGDLCVEGDGAVCTGPNAEDPLFTTLTVGSPLTPLNVDAGFSNPGEFIVESVFPTSPTTQIDGSIFVDPAWAVLLGAQDTLTTQFSEVDVQFGSVVIRTSDAAGTLG